MRRAATRVLPILALLLLVVAGCGSTDAATDKEVLISLTDQVVVPAYQSFSQDMARLDRDVGALCSAPSGAALETARQSWLDARASWMMTEAMWFGPVMDRRSIRLLDWSPTDVSGIDALLAERRTFTATQVGETLASNLRGLGAIEYVLFGSDSLANPDESGPHCSYLTALTEVAHEETDAVLSEWLDGTDRRPPYKDFFTGRGSASVISSEAVAEVVRTQVFFIRDTVDMRLASAFGLRGDAPDFSMVPGTAADNGLQDLRHEMLGMQTIYEGRGEEGLGISALVRPLSEDTDKRLRYQFQAAIEAIESVEGPLSVAIRERPEQVNAVYESLSNVQITVSTEVVSLLGVSVGFTDTDGDSQR